MEFYIGTITKIIDQDLYTIEVDVPGLQVGLRAFPKRSELDEPRVGDVVLLQELDPDFKSYYIYEKLKESKFIGVRSRGKQINITEEDITIGIFDGSTDWNEKGETPEVSSWIKIDKSGNINIKATGKTGVDIEGNIDLTTKGNINITSEGNATVSAKKVTVTGGQMVMRGMANNDTQGPFNCIPICPFSGAPHSGSQVSGT